MFYLELLYFDCRSFLSLVGESYFESLTAAIDRPANIEGRESSLGALLTITMKSRLETSRDEYGGCLIRTKVANTTDAVGG